jgi:hypothetical protein
MRHKLGWSAVLAVLLAIGGGSLAFAGDDGHGRGHDGDHGRTFVVTLVGEEQTDIDLGASGPGAGDRFTVFAPVARDGQTVGSGGYECVTLHFEAGSDPAGPPAAETDQCVATLSLDKGQITAQGLVDRVNATLPLAVAITGGTGAYRNAHGQIETSGPDDAGNEALTIRLSLDDD